MQKVSFRQLHRCSQTSLHFETAEQDFLYAELDHLKLQEKNLLKYVIFILLTNLLNHDYAIRHVFLS